jgi:hypothetical protein
MMTVWETEDDFGSVAAEESVDSVSAAGPRRFSDLNRLIRVDGLTASMLSVPPVAGLTPRTVATKANPSKGGDAKLRGYRTDPRATLVEPPNNQFR